MLFGVIATMVLFSGCSNYEEKRYDDGQAPETIPRICTLEYDPVCGINGETYTSECAAGDVEIAYKGVCEEKESLNPRYCTQEYNLQCGADGLTYLNPCTAGIMTIVHAGSCE